MEDIFPQPKYIFHTPGITMVCSSPLAAVIQNFSARVVGGLGAGGAASKLRGTP